VTVKATQEAITKGEDHSDTLPAILAGVTRDREGIFIECVHIHIITTTTDIKLCEFRKKDLNYVKSFTVDRLRPLWITLGLGLFAVDKYRLTLAPVDN
jgi:hypothetical protein